MGRGEERSWIVSARTQNASKPARHVHPSDHNPIAEAMFTAENTRVHGDFAGSPLNAKSGFRGTFLS